MHWYLMVVHPLVVLVVEEVVIDIADVAAVVAAVVASVSSVEVNLQSLALTHLRSMQAALPIFC